MALILGIWDGHDSGAALIRGDQVLAAVNEERFTRRKLEVRFPFNSIAACLKIAGIAKEEIRIVAAATHDFSKTLTRLFPGLKEQNYQIRRRKKFVPFVHLQKRAKFFLTTFGSSWLSRTFSESLLTRRLRRAGLKDFDFLLFDHHAAHAACAAYCAPFDSSTVVTLDGVGDGASATIHMYENHILKRIAEVPAVDSLGVFFEQVTFLLNLRELEDEGKVMALSSFAFPDSSNSMLDFFTVNGLSIRARYSPGAMFSKLEELAWKLPWEQFAWMAQDTLEKKALEFFRNAVGATRLPNVAWSGGVAANIKMNQKIRNESGLKSWFVFPHMGDGGLALGAALCARALLGSPGRIDFEDVYLGPSFSEEEISAAAKSAGKPVQIVPDIEEKAAQLLAEGNIVLWFQGRMEFGPRALGNRSILAPPDNLEAKNRLNRILKRRSWFQPFCPSILAEKAREVFEDFDGASSPYMTMAYQVNLENRERFGAVTAVDFSCRPQLLGGENPIYRRLISNYEQSSGNAILLNTSFNRHGEPLVATPLQAVNVFLEAGFPYLIMDHFLLENLKGTGPVNNLAMGTVPFKRSKA